MESNRTISWNGYLKINYIDPKAELWMLESLKKSVKDNLKHFQNNYIVHNPYSQKEFIIIKKEMTSSIRKIKSLSRKIRKVKTKQIRK